MTLTESFSGGFVASITAPVGFSTVFEVPLMDTAPETVGTGAVVVNASDAALEETFEEADTSALNALFNEETFEDEDTASPETVATETSVFEVSGNAVPSTALLGTFEEEDTVSPATETAASNASDNTVPSAATNPFIETFGDDLGDENMLIDRCKSEGLTFALAPLAATAASATALSTGTSLVSAALETASAVEAALSSATVSSPTPPSRSFFTILNCLLLTLGAVSSPARFEIGGVGCTAGADTKMGLEGGRVLGSIETSKVGFLVDATGVWCGSSFLDISN
mmetsp:Transcript_2244/g.3046  ORF Transcript_2244/g.3046 Transcript_2244/m.3046 type:complete len:284 (-) Transcript_2244:2768-3619(-)